MDVISAFVLLVVSTHERSAASHQKTTNEKPELSHNYAIISLCHCRVESKEAQSAA
jgi:hypothetical protein